MWLKVCCRIEERDERHLELGKLPQWSLCKEEALHLKKGEGMLQVSEMNPTCSNSDICRELWPRTRLCLPHGSTHDNCPTTAFLTLAHGHLFEP